MRQLKSLLLIAAVALSIVGCRKPVEVSFENASLEFDALGETIEIALKSNGEWVVEPSVDWIAIAPMSGNGDAMLTLTAEANTTEESRSAEVKVTTKDDFAVLSLTQGKLENYVIVTPKEILCDSEGGSFTIAVSSNIDWTVSAPEWISCSQAHGSGDGSVTLTINPMDGGDSEGREAQVFFGNLITNERVHVVQTVEPVLNINLTPNTLFIACTGETQTVTVTTEDSWTAAVEVDWITLSQTEGQGEAEISVTVDENPFYLNRIASVTFTTLGGVHAVLTIRQDATPDPHFLDVSPLDIEFGNEGGEHEINIDCDTEWALDLNCEWISLSQMSGTGSAIVVLTAEQNEWAEPRSANFVVKSGSLSKMGVVRQAPGGTVIVATLEPDSLFVPYVGGLQHIELASNTSWSLQYSEWIDILATTSGEGDASFDIIIDSNSDSDDRIGFVKVIHNDQIMAVTVVVQEGKKDILETDINELDVRLDGGDFDILVTANQSWTISTTENWLHCNPQEGYGTGHFTITVDPATRPRSGAVKVSGSLGAAVVIKINQH